MKNDGYEIGPGRVLCLHGQPAFVLQRCDALSILEADELSNVIAALMNKWRLANYRLERVEVTKAAPLNPTWEAGYIGDAMQPAPSEKTLASVLPDFGDNYEIQASRDLNGELGFFDMEGHSLLSSESKLPREQRERFADAVVRMWNAQISC